LQRLIPLLFKNLTSASCGRALKPAGFSIFITVLCNLYLPNHNPLAAKPAVLQLNPQEVNARRKASGINRQTPHGPGEVGAATDYASRNVH